MPKGTQYIEETMPLKQNTINSRKGMTEQKRARENCIMPNTAKQQTSNDGLYPQTASQNKLLFLNLLLSGLF